ncbi:MAG: 4Fe-4S ferredoxin, partial [Deltaproteobacteria bacterium]|nr:4Fe-4S ferredoxin [Deltaproteobacteria bacterium]
NCPEGALQIIDGKVRLVSESSCDGLGACLGHCPEGALTVEEAPAEPYDEAKVMERIIGHGKNVVAAHLQHLEDHGQKEYLAQALAVLKKKGMDDPRPKKVRPMPRGHASGGCPGSRTMDMREGGDREEAPSPAGVKLRSELQNWPLQLHLINPDAPYFDGRGLVVAADCVPFAHPNFHAEYLKGNTLTILCPKLDSDQEVYVEKLTHIFKNHDIPQVTVLHMEVPCCFGVAHLVREAQTRAGTKIPVKDVTISIRGDSR